MNKIAFLNLFIFLFITTAGYSQADNSNFKDFEQSFCLGSAPAMIVVNNDIVRISCDSAWILNKTRYHLMAQATEYVLHKDPNESLKLAAQYEKSLQSCSQNYADIMTKYQLLADDCSKTMHETQSTIQGMRNDIDKAQSKLKTASQNLEDTQKALARENRKSKQKAWIFGAGGIGVGLLVGVIFFGG
ncbi:MAG: hypothetical protein WCO63_03505 [Bacteroidota bacterium]